MKFNKLQMLLEGSKTIKRGKSYIKYSIERDKVVIDDLYVDPNKRGGKEGYKLLDMVKQLAINLGKNLSLYAEPVNDRASNSLNSKALINYYEKYGFTADPRIPQLMTMHL